MPGDGERQFKPPHGSVTLPPPLVLPELEEEVAPSSSSANVAVSLVQAPNDTIATPVNRSVAKANAVG
jgi:hypothetical protein